MTDKKPSKKTPKIKTTGRVDLGAMLAAIGKVKKTKKKAAIKKPNPDNNKMGEHGANTG